jgi:hypothetical protein
MEPKSMYTYQVRVENGFDAEAFNATGPLQIVSARREAASTLLRIHTDQSGLIGVLRSLHQQGYVLLSVSRDV